MARRNRDIRQLFVVVVMWKVLWKKDMHRLPSKNLHYKTSAISLFIIRLPIAFIVSYLGKLKLYNVSQMTDLKSRKCICVQL